MISICLLTTNIRSLLRISKNTKPNLQLLLLLFDSFEEMVLSTWEYLVIKVTQYVIIICNISESKDLIM